MANSTRQQILAAVVAALESITKANSYQQTVKHVSEILPATYSAVDMEKLPAAFPIDADEVKEPFSFGYTRSVLTVLISWVVYENENGTTQQRCDLLRDCEIAIYASSTLEGLCLLIEPTKVISDKGNIPNYSTFDQEFEFTYTYKDSDGG